MAKIDTLSWREQKVTLQPNLSKEAYFSDTQPNYLLVSNSGAYPIYVSVSPLVSGSNFDLAIPAYGTKLFHRPSGVKSFYLYVSSVGDIPVTIQSWEGEFDPTAISQSQEITALNVNAQLGTVDIKNPLPAGLNNIGKIDVNALPMIPPGTNNIGDVDVLTLPSIPAGVNNIGKVDVNALPMLPAGTNNIGDVDVLTLPSIPAGVNNMGKVDVNALPMLPVGTNNIGKVDVNALPALPVGTNNIGKVDVNALPALPVGTNNIGKVDVNALPALPVGTNNIGKVDVNALPNVESIGFTSQKVTAAAPGDISVKASAGKVVGIRSVGAVNVYLKDGATQIWDIIAGGSQTLFTFPITCATSIILNFSAAGDAYIIYK